MDLQDRLNCEQERVNELNEDLAKKTLEVSESRETNLKSELLSVGVNSSGYRINVDTVKPTDGWDCTNMEFKEISEMYQIVWTQTISCYL
eukprot:UN33997